jgi:hypothetical protein
MSWVFKHIYNLNFSDHYRLANGSRPSNDIVHAYVFGTKLHKMIWCYASCTKVMYLENPKPLIIWNGRSIW